MNNENALLTIYKAVYGIGFDPKRHGDKLKMQKAVYLPDEQGVFLGDFDFFWHINGPYSIDLHRSINNIEKSGIYSGEKCTPDTEVKFTEFAKQQIEKLQVLFKVPDECRKYNTVEWCEAIGSLHYLKKYKCGSLNEADLLGKLEFEKKNLRSRQDNKLALSKLNEYMNSH